VRGLESIKPARGDQKPQQLHNTASWFGAESAERAQKYSL